ncbi:hypothetical protein N7535_006929 [Penicillium sp. DV-2018c]|nr:hypothetical protein N7535_006929 [Penicillium sp. DV-2018c]
MPSPTPPAGEHSHQLNCLVELKVEVAGLHQVRPPECPCEEQRPEGAELLQARALYFQFNRTIELVDNCSPAGEAGEGFSSVTR